MLKLLIFFLFSDSLEISVTGWKGNSRCMGIAFYDEEGYEKDNPNMYSSYQCFGDTKSNKNSFLVGVPSKEGKFAIAIFQDLNGNKKLDKNKFGIPTEPYVFSGKIKSKWKKPSFNEVAFLFKRPFGLLELELKNWQEY